MAYKPKVVSSGGGGPRGKAVVALNQDKTKVKVVMQMKNPTTKEEYTKDFVLKADDCPKYIQSGEFMVSLSADEKKMFSMYPAQGMFKGKVSKFVSEEGKEPAPKTNETFNYQYFTVLVEITEPKKYKGMEVPFFLHYHFTEAEDEVKGKPVKVVAFNHPKSKHTGILSDFCDANKVWNKGPMPYSANILPALSKRIASQDQVFQWVMKEGYVSAIFSTTDLAETEDKPEPKAQEEEFDSETTPDEFTPDVEKETTSEDSDEFPW